MKVKFADKIYNVHGIKLSAGVAWFKIEDEPNHFDWVTNVEVVGSSTYGIKKQGNAYPTKPAIFSDDDWQHYRIQAAIAAMQGIIISDDFGSIMIISLKINKQLMKKKIKLK